MTTARLHPLELMEIVEQVTSYLDNEDLKQLRDVNCLWNQSCQKWINSRRQSYSSMRWNNPSKQRHPWYSLCGNTTLFHHTHNCGALEQIHSWTIQELSNNSTQLVTQSAAQKPPFVVFLFSTGLVYINYLVQKGYMFLIHEELFSAHKIKSTMMMSMQSTGTMQIPMLFMTSLKLMSCKECCHEECDVMTLKIPQFGSNIHPFQFCESKIKALFVETNAPKDIKDWQIHLFKNITGVDPENTKIKGIVVFNVKELMHVFRRIWQDFGPFPLIGCDSEGITWNFMDESVMNLGLSNQSDFLTSTSGFLITDDSGQEKVQTASIILDVNSNPKEQVQKLIQSGFEPKSSWGIALSSSLRGYDGDDITAETIEAKDALQKLECSLFHSVVGMNFVGAQVEDVFGTNHILNSYQKVPFDEKHCDNFGLFTPEIQADDSSTVLFVMKQQ